MIEDVPCVRIYQAIREGVGSGARRLGVGRNLFPPNPKLASHLSSLFGALLGGQRLAGYESEADDRERALVAELLRRYLADSRITADDVFFVHGAQEGISVTMSYGAQLGMEALLPLPLYYAFEQSSRRWGVPIAGHYGGDGSVHWHRALPERPLRVQVVPNGVTGTLFFPPRIAPSLNGEAGLDLVDFVFQLGAFAGAGSLGEPSRSIVHATDLERAVLLFTVSKDLSLPGLRAGLLVSRNRELMRYAKADRFERLYSISPLIGQAVALYLALVLLYDQRSSSTIEGEVRRTFQAAGFGFPNERDLLAILRHFDAMTRRCLDNLALVGRTRSLLLDAAWAPTAGYSVFPAVAFSFAGDREFLAWIRHAGVEHSVKLNPSYLYGGTAETWNALYPGQYRMRVNVSDAPDALDLTLRRLAAALAHALAV
jgi:histidinol-phosphate/aromatic aminotransferase/cobyric acid decarboxylase-like protein